MRIAIWVFALLGFAALAAGTDPLSRVTWYGQSCLKIAGTKGTVWIDPFKVPEGAKGTADLVLVTHAHFDHLDKDQILKVAKPAAPVYGPAEVEKEFPGRGHKVSPGGKYEAAGFSFRTVPAYNIGKPYHSKEKGWVGFLLDVDGNTYYAAGDTDFIPEMRGLKPAVAFLPIGGTYTMDWREAAQAAKVVGAAVTVPYHWGTLEGVGTEEDARKFQGAAGVKVVVLPLPPVK
jgi:L-ascorbate metabolism protein UlaG (beta-lactamase superfamily)